MRDLEIGQTVEGIVKRLTPLGVWLDIGAKKKKGLIEVGEWLEDGGFPVDFDKAKELIGQRLSARVLRFSGVDLFLTRRKGELERPLLKRGLNNESDVLAFVKVPPQKWFSAQVVGMAPWGVYATFREWPGGRVQGLVHRSHFAEGYAAEALVGQRIRVRILDVDLTKLAIALTMREPAHGAAPVGEPAQGAPSRAPAQAAASVGEPA